MTFIPESVRFASESFSVVYAVIIAVLAAIVMTGFWEFLFQEIKLKRHEQKCRRITATRQKIESDRDLGRGNGIDVGGGRECATIAKSGQSTMRHFGGAVELLQKLDSNRMCNNAIVDRVTQSPVSDLRRIRSARSSAKGNVQGSKEPVLFHGKGSKGELRQQKAGVSRPPHPCSWSRHGAEYSACRATDRPSWPRPSKRF